MSNEVWRAVFSAWGLPPSLVEEALDGTQNDDRWRRSPLGGREPADAGSDAHGEAD